MKNSLPWIFLGVGTLGLGAVLVLRKKQPTLAPGPLTPAVQQKVAAQIATSSSPDFLKQLATGLQNAGAPQEAMAALQKVADMTGMPHMIPATATAPAMTVSPGGGVASTASGPSSYRVVSGDIPGVIAKRFNIPLSAFAKANGATVGKRITAGQIRVGETLKLPVGARDNGPISHANGTVV